MSSKSDVFEVEVPDVGDVDEVEVVEVLVAVGDEVAEDDGLVTLESDKASMDVPSPRAGKVASVEVKSGDKVKQGTVIVQLEAAGDEEGKDEDEADGPEESSEEEKPAEKDERPEEEDEDTDETDEPSRDDEPSEKEPQSGAEDSKKAPGSKKASQKTERSKGDDDGDGGADGDGGDVHGQVVVLGSGPGGYTAAFRAADLGQDVVLIERYADLGGVCLNVGCIPSKALLHAAKVIAEVEEFAQHGLVFGKPRIQLPQLRRFKEQVVGRLTGGLSQLAKKRGVTVVQGEARLVSDKALEVEGESGTRRVTFDHLILAAGSRPVELPGFPTDDPRVMDNVGALALEDIPDRLLVVGGGIIGLEMATVYAALGSAVTVVELTDSLMPGTDRDLVRPLKKRLEPKLEAVYLKTKVTGVQPKKEGLVVSFEGDSGAPPEATFDRVLVSVGRRPNGDRIGAEAAGLKLDERGFLPVDEEQRTNVRHIFAIGDMVGPPMLAHKATHEGKVAAEVAAGEKSAFVSRVIPSVAYTDPEVAWVGLTETEAKRDGVKYEKGTFPWSASGRSLGMGRDEGLTKILFDPDTQRVLGAGIVGPSAGDLISELALAIEMDCEAADIALTIHPHPTLSETVAFAAEAFEGTLTDLYVPKKRKKH